jgi:hypothetical protein
LLRVPAQGRHPDPGYQGHRGAGPLRDDEGVIQAPGTFINLAVELGLIDELTHLVLAEIVKSIDLINETFGADTSISINVAAKQAGNPEFMRSFAEALEATGFPERFMIEVTEDAFVAKTGFRTRSCRSSASSGSDFDRRFRHRLFVAVGAGRHHRRRNQDRPLLHHRHPSASAQPGHPAGDRIAERGARHDRDRGRHRNLRGTRLSAGRHPHPLCAGLLFFQADFPGRTQARDPDHQRARVSLASRPPQENRRQAS